VSAGNIISIEPTSCTLFGGVSVTIIGNNLGNGSTTIVQLAGVQATVRIIVMTLSYPSECISLL